MAKRKKGLPVNGWVNLNKPVEMTSTQAVGAVRRLTGAAKAGHAGTLDPLASGILPIALGEATKTVPYCQDCLKTYEFEVTWGEQRDTDDAEGKIIDTSDGRPEKEAIEALLPEFTGEIEQTPPRFSAIKIEGKRAYDMARAGEDVKIKPRQVFIQTLSLIQCGKDKALFRSTCGKGTYIRSLARDMAQKLGTCGYVSALTRTAVGPFTLDNAISLAKLEQDGHSAALAELLLPVETALDDIPALAIKEQEAARLKQGQPLLFVARPDMERLHKAGLDITKDMTGLATLQGKPIALVNVNGPEIKPFKVLNL